MKKPPLLFIGLALLILIGCRNTDDFPSTSVEIPDFNFPQTVVFEPQLSAYGIFQGNPADLIPAADFHELELTSILYTDQAHKQRLVRVPAGTQMTRLDDGAIDFPDGTILTKTFSTTMTKEIRVWAKGLLKPGS